MNNKPKILDKHRKAAFKACEKFSPKWEKLSAEETLLARKVTILTEYAGGRSKAAEVMNVGPTTVDNYRLGVTQPKILELFDLVEAANLTVEYLISGSRYEDIFFDLEESNLVTQKLSDAQYKDFSRSIPHYDIEAHAGNGSMEMVADISKYMSFDAAWFDKYVPASAVLGALDINGDSMQPTLNQGDMIIVNMNREAIKEALAEGGIFVLAVRGDFKVKRLQPMIDGSLRMISDNPRYQEEVIPKDILESDVYIQGHVIWIGGPPK